MREVLLNVITLGICLISPVHPKFGLFGYYWFALMRPDILAWSGPNRYSMAVALFTLLFNIPNIMANAAEILRSSLLRMLLLLVFVILLSSLFAVSPELCLDPLSQFGRVLVMAIIIPLIIRSKQDMNMFFVVCAASLGLLGAKFGLGGVLAGGVRFAQGYGGMLSDNNTMALAFAMAIPLCWYARFIVNSKSARLGFIAAAILCAAAVVFTHSRGGVLSAGFGLVYISLRAKYRIIVFALMLVSLGGISYMVWDSLASRMATVAAPAEEGSAKSRLLMMKVALAMAKDYPVLGVGFGMQNEVRLAERYTPADTTMNLSGKVIHNTYLQMLTDSGALGLAVYLTLLGMSLAQLERSIRRTVTAWGKEAAAVPYGLQCSLLVFCVGSFFLSRTMFDLIYVLIATSAGWLAMEARGEFALAAAPAAEPLAPPPPATPPPPAMPEAGPTKVTAPWIAQPQTGGRLRMGRERNPRP